MISAAVFGMLYGSIFTSCVWFLIKHGHDAAWRLTCLSAFVLGIGVVLSVVAALVAGMDVESE